MYPWTIKPPSAGDFERSTKKAMPRIQKKRAAASTYCRSNVVTLGSSLVAAGIFNWQHESSESAATWAWSGFAVLSAFLLGGAALVLFGTLGLSRKMENWAAVLSRHEASLITMALAYRMYLLISPF